MNSVKLRELQAYFLILNDNDALTLLPCDMFEELHRVVSEAGRLVERVLVSPEVQELEKPEYIH